MKRKNRINENRNKVPFQNAISHLEESLKSWQRLISDSDLTEWELEKTSEIAKLYNDLNHKLWKFDSIFFLKSSGDEDNDNNRDFQNPGWDTREREMEELNGEEGVIESFESFFKRSVNEAKEPKTFTIEREGKTGSKTKQKGTLEELIKKNSYTLETGKSYEKEKGNKKIDLNPKSIKSLIKNLENAADNAAKDGYSGVTYREVVDSVDEKVSNKPFQMPYTKDNMRLSIKGNSVKELLKKAEELKPREFSIFRSSSSNFSEPDGLEAWDDRGNDYWSNVLKNKSMSQSKLDLIRKKKVSK